MFSDLTKRQVRRGLVLEFNPFQVLAAEISRPHRGVVSVDAAAEFERHDIASLNEWIESRVATRAICGLVPRRGIVQRESLQPRRLPEPGYLADVVEEQQKGRFLSSTPFKVLNPEAWTLRALNAVDGRPLNPDAPVQPAVICGIANEEIQEVQQRLLDEGVLPDRIESGLLSLFGAVYRMMERRGEQRAVAIIVIHQVATTVYILGKEGIHTPNPVFHGFTSIIELARKELGFKEDAEVRSHLQNAHPLLVKYGDKLVRRIGRDLKPVMDSYEMTTGQPVDEVFCAYLPPNLAWLGEPLARVTGRMPMTVDCQAWLSDAAVHAGEDCPPFGPHWLGALSLMADLPEDQGLKPDRVGSDELSYHRPWHLDYRLAAVSAERRAAGRRFLTGAVAVALAIFALGATAWQLYATHTLSVDLRYWETQMVENRKLFDGLTAANAQLQTQSGALRRAYELMAAPFQPSDFMLHLGRTIPPHMRVDRIDTDTTRAAIVGALLQPAEEATATLGRYMEDLRRNQAIGPFFSHIFISSLERKANTDAVLFEITLVLRPLTPTP